MTIRTKLLGGFLVVNLLAGVVGAVAAHHWLDLVRAAAFREAANIAETIEQAIILDSGTGRPMFADPKKLQEYVYALHLEHQRDVVVVNKQLMTIADADPKEVGQHFNEGGDRAVALTLADGRERAFLEAGHEEHAKGIPQVVVPIEIKNEIVGAVILQRDPLERQLIALSQPFRNLTLIATALCIATGVIISVALSRKFANPLHALREAALKFAQEGIVTEVKRTSNDEIGDLVSSFNAMMKDRLQAEKQHAYNAMHDGLTGLPNRAWFLERVAAAISTVRRHPERTTAVLFIDLDGFKLINDSFGHETGDAFLCQVSERLKSFVRADDSVARANPESQAESLRPVARMGGDEFTILLEDLHGPSDAVRVAERIRAALLQPFQAGDHELYAGCSIGVAIIDHRLSPEEVIRNADLAMYRAKTHGKNRCELFDEEMHARAMARLKLETELRHAISHGELMLHYQPIIDLRTGSITGVEALVRWERPGVGLVGPSEFLAAAEEAGMMVSMGTWVLREACRAVARLNREQAPANHGLRVSVNVSGKQFSAPGFVEQVSQALQESGLEPRLLELEITENTAMEDAELARDVLSRLHSLGVKLSLDDFGTGYSSLSYLRRFAVDVVKIDRAFVSHVDQDTENAAIVHTIVALARVLGLRIVAEGVETVEELQRIKDIDCDFGQGFLFSRPVPLEEVSEILRGCAAQKPTPAIRAVVGA